MTTRPSPIAVSPDGNLKIYPKGTEIFSAFDRPATVRDAIAIFEFEGVPLHAVTLDGQTLFSGIEVGRAIDYGHGNYVDSIRDWAKAGEMRERESIADLRDDGHFVCVQGDALNRVKSVTTVVAGSKTHRLVMLTKQGVIRAAMLAGGPKAIRFRDWIEKVVLNVITAGAHIEPGAAVEPKPLPLVAAELRRIGDRLWRAKRFDEATDCYLRAGEVGLGRAFLTTTPAPPAQLSLPLPTVTVVAATEPEPAPKSKDKSKGKPPWVPKTPPDDGNDWSGFVRAWAARFGYDDDVVPASKLLSIVDGFIKIKAKNEAGRASKLGKLLDARKYCVIAGFKIDHQNSTIRGWSLVKQ